MMLVMTMLLQSAMLTPAPAIADLPRDVQRFIARYGQCQHWMGEEGGDAARRAQIARGAAKSCKGIDAAGDKLKRRYAANASVTTALVAYPPLTP